MKTHEVVTKCQQDRRHPVNLSCQYNDLPLCVLAVTMFCCNLLAWPTVKKNMGEKGKEKEEKRNERHLQLESRRPKLPQRSSLLVLHSYKCRQNWSRL